MSRSDGARRRLAPVSGFPDRGRWAPPDRPSRRCARPLRPFPSAAPLHPSLYEESERSGGRRGAAEGKRRSRRRPAPRDRRVTRENVPLADVLAGYPAISCVRAASERYGRRCHGAGAVAGASAVVACRPATALLTGCGGLYPDNVQKTSRNTFSAGLQRCGLSKSATKARIEPERARRIVGIPRFSSRPIPPRSAFVADLDTTPPRLVPGAPHVPPC